MKAAQYSRYGGPEVIEINQVDKPVPKAGQVLVAVRGAAINPFDFKLRSGAMKDAIPVKFPVTIGGDFSGAVEAVGPEVTGYKVGDEVFGSAMVLGGGSGALAEYTAANIASLSNKPTSLDHLQAAAMVLVGVSAFDAIDKLELSKGQKLLIHGGAGGIGSAAIQYAKHLGLAVVTTARAADADFVRQMGADEVIDFENQDFTKQTKDLDGVFDTVGGDVYRQSFGVIRSGSKIVSMSMPPDEDLARQHQIMALMQNTKVTSASLSRLAKLIGDKVIEPQIDRVFSLDNARKAFEYLESGRHKGKVVIEVSKL